MSRWRRRPAAQPDDCDRDSCHGNNQRCGDQRDRAAWPAPGRRRRLVVGIAVLLITRADVGTLQHGVDLRGILAPERVRTRRRGERDFVDLRGLVVGRGCLSGISAERHQLVARPEPVAREWHDVAHGPGLWGSFLAFGTVGLHRARAFPASFAELFCQPGLAPSSVGGSISSELVPVCLN
jgi:hypothetical protein